MFYNLKMSCVKITNFLSLFFIFSTYAYSQEINSSEVILQYFLEKTPVTLKCSRDVTQQSMESFRWVIGSTNITEENIENHKEEYELGSDFGDIVLLNPVEGETASCYVTHINGEESVFNQFVFTPGRVPEVNFYVDGTMVEYSYAWELNGTVEFSCKAKNSTPMSNLSLVLNGEVLQSAIDSEVVAASVTFTEELHGNQLACQVDHTVETLQKLIRLVVKLPPSKSEDAHFTDAVIGSPFNLTFFFRSPIPVIETTWSYSDNCSLSTTSEDFEDQHVALLEPELVSTDSTDEYFASMTIDNLTDADMNRCFYMNVANEMGSLLFEMNVKEASPQGLLDLLTIGWVTALTLFIVGSLILSFVLWFLLWRKKSNEKTAGYSSPGHDMENLNV